MSGRADHLHLVAAQVDLLARLDQPLDLERRQAQVIDVAEVDRLRHLVEAVVLLERANEGQVRQVDTVEVVQAAQVIEVQVRGQHR
ncbi:hypothetical protein D9M70_557380 [compost metagenome]